MCKKNKDLSIACFVDEMEFICSDLVVNDVLKFILKNITSPLLIVNSSKHDGPDLQSDIKLL